MNYLEMSNSKFKKVVTTGVLYNVIKSLVGDDIKEVGGTDNNVPYEKDKYYANVENGYIYVAIADSGTSPVTKDHLTNTDKFTRVKLQNVKETMEALASITQGINEEKQKVTQLTTDVSELKTKTANLTQMGTDISTLKQKTGAIEGRLTPLETFKREKETQIETNKNDITALKAKESNWDLAERLKDSNLATMADIFR